MKDVTDDDCAYKCDNCQTVLPREKLVEAKDLWARLDVGGPYTDVECPECGALCYPSDGSDEAEPGKPFPLRIAMRPMPVAGLMVASACGVELLVDSGQNPQGKAVALWHEVLKLVARAGGRPDRNQAQIEEMAVRLADACPEILDLCASG